MIPINLSLALHRGGTPAYLFDPLTLNPIAWHDDTDITTKFQDSLKTTPVTATGQVVGAVEDKSGNGFDLLQPTPALKPVHTDGLNNGLPGTVFDGIDDYMQDLLMNNHSPVDVYLVVRIDSHTLGAYIFGSTFAAGFNGAGRLGFSANVMAIGSVSPTVAYNVGQFYILRFSFNGTDAILSHDGTPVLTNAGYTDGINDFALGASASGVNPVAMSKMEDFIVPTLSVSDDAKIVAYLKANNKL